MAEMGNRYDIHVVPVRDLRQHNDRSRHCWCNPRVERIDPETGEPYPYDNALVTHNAADGRELVERHGLQ